MNIRKYFQCLNIIPLCTRRYTIYKLYRKTYNANKILFLIYILISPMTSPNTVTGHKTYVLLLEQIDIYIFILFFFERPNESLSIRSEHILQIRCGRLFSGLNEIKYFIIHRHKMPAYRCDAVDARLNYDRPVSNSIR